MNGRLSNGKRERANPSDDASILFYAVAAAEFSRWRTHDGLEFLGKMRVIEILEILRAGCDIEASSRQQFGCFMETVATDHSFRRDADVVGKEALQRARR